MIKSNYKQVLLHLSLIGVFAFLAMSSSFYRGITSGGNDLSQHYQFAASIHSSLISGVIYPSFVAEVNHGFGDVALRFYPPFSYYVLASIYMLVQDWYLASLLAFFLVFLCGGIGVYLWAKEEFSDQQALIAAAIFTFAPYHLNQIYNTFLFAEFSATAIIPFCFLFLTRICQKSDKFSFIGLTVSFALLILTHLPLTIICSITLSLYGFLLLKKETIFSVLPKLIFSVFCALALSSFYWVRMITEMSWSKHSTPEYFSDAWDYRANFLLLPEHFVNFQDDVLSLWVSDLMLLAVIFLAIPTLILIVKSKFAVSRLVIAILIVFIFTIFMTTPLSRFIWDNLSFLQKVQFPWRWIGVVSLFGSILASIGIIHVSETLKTSKNILLPIGIGAILFFFVFTSAFLIKDAVYRTHEEFGHQIKNVQNAQSFDCWWAIWWQKSAFDQTETVLIENRKVDIQFSNSTERNFLIGQGEKGLASISTFYYPHWKVLINNSPVEVTPSDSGLISFPVPPQQSQVLLYFQEPPSVVAAFYLSSFAWLFFLLLFSFSLFRHFLFSNPILSEQS